MGWHMHGVHDRVSKPEHVAEADERQKRFLLGNMGPYNSWRFLLPWLFTHTKRAREAIDHATDEPIRLHATCHVHQLHDIDGTR